MELDDITGAIIDTALKIHTDLGPGLLESVYEIVLSREIQNVVSKSSDKKPFRSNTRAFYLMKDFGLTCWLRERLSWKSSLSKNWPQFMANSF